jgi:heme oxygenase
MGAVAMLRAATAGAHDRVDAGFGGYDLAAAAGYRGFLLAHARALPAAERRMAMLPFAATLAPRMPLLMRDLAALGVPAPPAMSLESDADEASAWGLLYVVEGSRLGGAVLARGVPADWPAAYLGAVHPAGQWRAIRGAIDAAAEGQDADWHARMVAGALDAFALYERASRTQAAVTKGGILTPRSAP